MEHRIVSRYLTLRNVQMTRRSLIKQLGPIDDQKLALPSVKLDELVRDRNEIESVNNKPTPRRATANRREASNSIRTMTRSKSEFKTVRQECNDTCVTDQARHYDSSTMPIFLVGDEACYVIFDSKYIFEKGRTSNYENRR